MAPNVGPQLAPNVGSVEANDAQTRGNRLQLSSDMKRADTSPTFGVILFQLANCGPTLGASCNDSPHIGRQLVSDEGRADTMVPNMYTQLSTRGLLNGCGLSN